MTTEYRRKINKNSNFTYKTEINLEDEYKIYTQEYKLEFKDECSKIFLLYSINKYNDGILLTPNKTFTINYQIDFGNGIN